MAEPKKILVTGANGLLGQKVTEIFKNESTHELILTDLKDKAEEPRDFDYFPMDITKKEDVKEVIKKISPDIIINTAAYTNVDGC
jgi:dTDP-4-dehydrorhamnose reductase